MREPHRDTAGDDAGYDAESPRAAHDDVGAAGLGNPGDLPSLVLMGRFDEQRCVHAVEFELVDLSRELVAPIVLVGEPGKPDTRRPRRRSSQ